MPVAEETRTVTGRGRWLRRIGVLLLLRVLLAGAAAWYLNSESFRNYVRYRIVSGLEDATGGRVELGKLDLSVWRGDLHIEDLTVHGLEPSGTEPYIHVDRASVGFDVLSFIHPTFSFRYVSVDRPAVHLIVYPDGSTNQPVPRKRADSRKPPIEELFDIAIDRLEVRSGLLIVNEQRWPLNLTASDVSSALKYARGPESYEGYFGAGKIDTDFDGYRPFSSSADIHFRLFRSSAEITSLKLRSQQSWLEGNGRVADFREPVLQLNYRATVDLQQIGSIIRRRELRSGTLTLEGAGVYGSTQRRFAGRLSAKNAAWTDSLVRLKDVAVSGDFSVDRDQIELSRLSGVVAGGTATGNLIITNWMPQPEPQGGTTAHNLRAQRVQAGKVQLTFNNLSVASLAEAFGNERLPLAHLRPAGAANGTLETTWNGNIARSTSRLNFDVASTGVSPGRLPVSGHLQATYKGATRTLQISSLELRTQATHVSATGAIGTGDTSLQLDADTSDLSELGPLFEAQGENRLPIEAGGQVSFTGTLRGKFAFPEIAGQLRITNFTALITPPGPSAQEPQLVAAMRRGGRRSAKVPLPEAASSKPFRFHWDSFSGQIVFGPSAGAIHNGRLHHGSAEIRLEGIASLEHGRFTETSRFQANASARDFALSDAQQLMDVQYPVSGTLQFELSLSGTKADPHGEGRIAVTNGSAYGQPLDSVSSDLRFTGQEVQFDSVHLRSAGAEVTGSGAFNVGTRAFRYNAHGTGIETTRFRRLQIGKTSVAGIAEVTTQGSGTVENPNLQAEIRVPDVKINGRHAGTLTANGVTRGDNLKLTARAALNGANLSLESETGLRADWPSSLTLKFTNLDLQPLLEGYARGHSIIDGTLQASGPLRSPMDASATLDITNFVSVVEGVRVENNGPIRLSFAQGTASINNLHFVGEDTDLSASGTASFRGRRDLNLRADGKLNLKLLQSFYPDIVAYGSTSIGMQVRGSVSEPALSGRITIAHAGVSYIDLPNGLSDVNGAMVFNEDRLQVEQLTAHTGGGDLKLGGFIAYRNGLSFNVTAVGTDVRIRYPEGVSSNADANLRLVGTLRSSTLSGDIVVNRFSLNPRFDFATYLQRAKRGAQVQNPQSPVSDLRLDVHVTSAPELQFQTSLGRITGDVDLRLRGTAYNPVVLGRISILEGEVNFNGTKYHLDRGDIAFTNPTRIEPILDLEATARVSNYDISIGLHGTPDRLTSTYRSDPPLPTADVFALLAFGRTSQESSLTTTQTSFTESASNAVLGSALNAAVSNRVQRLFGVSRIKIDPEVGGPENNPNARITLEQQVSDKITLTYITNLTQSAQQVIQFQYNVNRNVSIVGVRDEYGIVGFEVQIRQRRK